MATPPGRRGRRPGPWSPASIAGKERGRRSAIDRDREQGARLERHDSKADPVCGARIVLDPIALGLKDADEFFPDGLPGLVRRALNAKDLLAGRQAKADDARDGVGGGSDVLRRHGHGRWKRGEGRAGCEQQRDQERDQALHHSPTFVMVTEICALPTPLMRTARFKTLSASKRSFTKR